MKLLVGPRHHQLDFVSDIILNSEIFFTFLALQNRFIGVNFSELNFSFRDNMLALAIFCGSFSGLVFARCVCSEWFLFVECSCVLCHVMYRRDEDFEHVTLGDSDNELESGQFAEFEKVVHVSHLHNTSVPALSPTRYSSTGTA